MISYFSDTNGNIVGVRDRAMKDRVNLINYPDEIRIKKFMVDRNIFMHLYFRDKENNADIFIPMKHLADDGRINNGDYVYTFKK